MNISHVTNVQTINVTNVTVNDFVNRGAATQVPAAAMTGSRPIQAEARPVTPQEFAAARPIIGQQPLSPAAATAGVTPAVARRMNLSPDGGPAHPGAPGPVVQAGALEPGFRPPLASHTAAAAEAPAAPEPASGGAAARHGAVPLAEPGTRPAGLPPPRAAHAGVAEPGFGQPGEHGGTAARSHPCGAASRRGEPPGHRRPRYASPGRGRPGGRAASRGCPPDRFRRTGGAPGGARRGASRGAACVARGRPGAAARTGAASRATIRRAIADRRSPEREGGRSGGLP